jgi:hypothetical protein
MRLRITPTEAVRRALMLTRWWSMPAADVAMGAPRCVVCGCTWHNACVVAYGILEEGGCYWPAGSDTCSACLGLTPRVRPCMPVPRSVSHTATAGAS